MCPLFFSSTSSCLLSLLLIWLLIVQDARLNPSSALASNTGPRIQILPVEPVFFINTEQPSSKVLTCKTAGERPGAFSQLKWTGPNRLDNADELMKRHSVTEEYPDSNVWVLEFRDPKPDDEGTYYCLGNFQQSDSFNVSVNVKLQNPIKLENCDTRQFLRQGSEAGKISCRIIADTPQVSLFKDNLPIEKFGNRYKWNNDDSLVVYGPVNEKDAGKYTIRVKSDTTGERKSHDIFVEIHSMPYFQNQDRSLKFSGVEDEPVELKCVAFGNPKPLVTWLDPMLRNLTSVGGYQMNLEAGTLLISKVSRRTDHGEFQCIAYNTVGQIRQMVPMYVGIRPLIDNFDNKTVDEGALVTWECRSRGDPKPKFSIRRHGLSQQAYALGDGVTRDIDVAQEGGGAPGYIYRLSMTANRSLSGIHYCNATNEAGTAERIGYLNVNFRPDLSHTPTEQFVKRGEKLVITCHVKSYPPPQITWKIDNSQIINVETSVKSDGHETHVIYMTPPMQQQSAYSRFICSASNTMGTTERMITARYITQPGIVVATPIDTTPTTAKLQLIVPNDGGDRVRFFKYRVEGRSLDFTNPFYQYRVDIKNDSILDASLDSTTVYTIRNLMPYYSYKVLISASNGVGDGDASEFHLQTPKPTRPDPPIIVKPRMVVPVTESSVVTSDYSDGYLLSWNPPELDNGDPVTKYLIKFGQITEASILSGNLQLRTVEQMNERPMYARLGPFETNKKYYFEVVARNNFGDSEPSSVTVLLRADKPPMPEFRASVFSLLAEPTTGVLVIILVLAIIALIIVDMVFCFFFQIGVTCFIRNLCCSSKANGVVADKTYT